MRLLLDTNVILDILLERADFYNDALDMMGKAISKGDHLYLSSSAATDIYYIVRRNRKSKERALQCIKAISSILTFAEVNESTILSATLSKIDDYEDAVVDMVAKSVNADFIVTRNVKHFKYSKNKVITPKDYCQLQKKHSVKCQSAFLINCYFRLEKYFSCSLFCFRTDREWDTCGVTFLRGHDHVCWPTED